MDVLRAAWRAEYINAPREENTQEHCIFCEYSKEEKDVENLLLVRGQTAFVMMNRYPYSSGHLMVIPYRHTNDFVSLSSAESLELIHLAQCATEAIKQALHPDGFNMGINLGKVAGAGIDAHLHLHVVPRWNGDTNFMSVTAETKVLPEALSATYERLANAWRTTQHL
ncbi:HIT domain-containing protein [Synergistaceae bacterium OttesenSCG-928-I11]|nr:HIT domain-containing protein [Synergistaceae bacterium OttesenSCG-928-I11]